MKKSKAMHEYKNLHIAAESVTEVPSRFNLSCERIKRCMNRDKCCNENAVQIRIVQRERTNRNSWACVFKMILLTW